MRLVFVLIGLAWIGAPGVLGCISANTTTNSSAACLNTCAETEYDCICGGCPSDCDSELYVCTASTGVPKCDHKELLPLKYQDFILFAILFVVLALSSAAGIGGGGLIIPLMLIIDQFQPYYGIPLSVTSIVGGSIVRFVVQVTQFHPDAKHRRLIDFHLVLLLLPSTLSGTIMGVLLNSISPTWLVVGIIFFVLTYATYETVKKALALRKQEKMALNAAAHGVNRGNDEDGDDEMLLSNVVWPKSSSSQVESLAPSDGVSGETEERRQLADIMLMESVFPWRYLCVTFVFLGLILLLSLMRGGRDKSQPSFAGVTCGSPAYITVVCTQFLLCIVTSIAAMWWVRKQFLLKVKSEYTFLRGDVFFTFVKIMTLPLWTTVAGFLAGFLGVGAGMILGPFLLSLGLLPTVSAATTSYMTLFTSSSASVQYIALGRVMPQYGIVMFLLAAVASYVGQRFIVGPIRKRNMTSLLVLILGGIIGAAAVLLCVTGGMQIIKDYKHGSNMGFKPLCMG